MDHVDRRRRRHPPRPDHRPGPGGRPLVADQPDRRRAPGDLPPAPPPEPHEVRPHEARRAPWARRGRAPLPGPRREVLPRPPRRHARPLRRRDRPGRLLPAARGRVTRPQRTDRAHPRRRHRRRAFRRRARRHPGPRRPHPRRARAVPARAPARPPHPPLPRRRHRLRRHHLRPVAPVPGRQGRAHPAGAHARQRLLARQRPRARTPHDRGPRRRQEAAPLARLVPLEPRPSRRVRRRTGAGARPAAYRPGARPPRRHPLRGRQAAPRRPGRRDVHRQLREGLRPRRERPHGRGRDGPDPVRAVRPHAP